MTSSLADLRSADAIGGGQSDDTAAIQSALDGFCNPWSTGVLELPVGVYRITKPLVCRGDWSYGLRLRGTHAAAGPSGAVLRYDGPPGEAVLELRGCSNTTVEHLSIDCGGKARAGISVMYAPETGKGTTGIWLDHLFIIGGVGKLGAAVVIGVDADGVHDERQCDRIVISNSLFNGARPAGTTPYGVLTGSANCKNFAIRDCGFTFFGTGIHFGGSGYMIVDGFAGGGQTITDFSGTTGNFEIRAGNSENSARLFMGATADNPCSTTITNFSWASAIAEDAIISSHGFLKLEGNDFRNQAKADAVPRVSLSSSAPSSLVSSGNFYMNVRGEIPVADAGTGRPFVGSPRVQSFGDYGSESGRLVMLAASGDSPSREISGASELVVAGPLRFGAAGAGVIRGETGPIRLNVEAGSSQSGTQFGNGKGDVTGLITGEGAWMFVHIQDKVAPNQSIFLGAEHDGLPCYKDKDGQVFLVGLGKAKKGK